MHRNILNQLFKWLNSTDRLPLVLRGARQVGKTWLVRKLATTNNKQLIELNFEKNLNFVGLFNTNNVNQIILNIESSLEITINKDNSLLFLDEIQVAPKILNKLRWFAEDLPELPIIAAGSLLEFTLAKHEFSMPVGRINYAYLEPMSFIEYLAANNKQKLIAYLDNFSWQDSIPEDIHLKLLMLFKEYIIIGGLPKAVNNWTNSEDKSLENVNMIHNDLLATYKDDFAKYQGRLAIHYLHDTLQTIPSMLGQKFIYRKVNPSAQSAPLRQVLNLLNQAKICHAVIATAANGLPLGSEINRKHFKQIFIDTGLVSAQLGLSLYNLQKIEDINLVNKGGLTEQVVGQLLRTNNPYYIEPKLYYWLRENRNSNAEIDYIIQHENLIIPIEVKSGSTGSLKSLHLFMDLKNLTTAVRINNMPPCIANISSKLHNGKQVTYKLLSIPFYFINHLHKLIANSAL